MPDRFSLFGMLPGYLPGDFNNPILQDQIQLGLLQDRLLDPRALTQNFIGTATFVNGLGVSGVSGVSGIGMGGGSYNYASTFIEVDPSAAARFQNEYLESLERSRSLLLEHLTKEQRETFENKGWFIVTGGKTKNNYRVRNIGCLNNNIELLKKGLVCGEYVAERICCHCSGNVPLYDHLLAQKISLMFNEEEFLAKANRHVV